MTAVVKDSDIEVVDLDPRHPLVRMPAFLDEGTMELISDVDDCGVIAATGTALGTPVVVFCTDPTVQGGAMGIQGCKVIVRAYERAAADGVPIVGLWHSGGARLREGVESLQAVGLVFAIMTRVSGRIPQISVVLGPAAGGAAYGPALTDVVVLGPEGRVFVTGPDVVRSVTGEDVDMLRLGGPEPHGRRSGVVHVVAASEREALAAAYPQLIAGKAAIAAKNLIPAKYSSPETSGLTFEVKEQSNTTADFWLIRLKRARGRIGDNAIIQSIRIAFHAATGF